MKNLILIPLMLGLICACELATKQFGFHHNPVNALVKAEKAIVEKNVVLWLEATDGVLGCAYGSTDKLQELENKLDLKNLKLNNLAEVQVKTYERVQFKGFISHYYKTYEAELLNTKTKTIDAKIVFKCDYELPEKLAHNDPLNTEKFKRAFCAITHLDLTQQKVNYNIICHQFVR